MSTSVGTADADIDSTEQASGSSLQSGIIPSDTRTRTPPLPDAAGNDDHNPDKAKDGLPRLQRSPSIKLQDAPPTSTSTSPYSSLQYAPRQKPAIVHRPSQSSFQSHSSLWKQQQQQQTASSSNTAEPSLLSSFPHSAASASSPVVSTMAIEGLSASDEQVQKNAEQISAAETLAKQQLRADAEELGVRVGSLGWAILEQIQSAPNAEWTELGELLNRGEATLLLPTSPLHSSEVTLSQAYNHIIFPTLQSLPSIFFTSSVKGKEKENITASLVTFKGLRAELVDDTDPTESSLHFTSFVPREDMKFVSQMRTVSKRTDLFKTLSPLPGTSKQTSSPSRFNVLAHASSLLLPPSLTRREESRNRSRSSSNGTLLSVEQRQSHRASASFATLFGGRREKKTSPSASGEVGTELKEAGDSGSAIQVAQPTRMINVAVIDGEIRRSQVLKDIAASTKASIKLRMRQGIRALPNDLIDVVCSFADMFVPPSATSAHATSAALSASTDTDHSRLGSNVPLLAPFLYTPDQLADIFQDFYNSIKAQLLEVEEEYDIQHALQQVEAVVCSEVYDRIFCPYASMDLYHDEALTSRIDVLDQMGISLQRLGLLLKEDESEESVVVKKGLDDIVEGCGKQLQLLDDRQCLSPSDKLEVLVSAHKIIVEGLGKLPKINLVDEVDAKNAAMEHKDSLEDKTADREKKPTSSTSSADLILPVLIYCIVKSNPSRLASNLLYIQRLHAEALARGEADYCLVNVQAAVAFLENVEAASLGLASDVRLVTALELEQQRRREDVNGLSATQGSQPLPMPMRMRSRVAHDVGELAGMSNRVITGVLGSSLGAFGRMMGAGTNYAMGIDAAVATPRINGEMHKKQKSVEDIRGFLSGGAAAKLGSVLNKVVAMENEGKEGREPMQVKRPLPVNPRTSSSSRPATDYGAESDDRRKVLPNSTSLPSASKVSITDRLASLPHLSRTATGSPAPSTAQVELVSPAFSARDNTRVSASKSGSLRINSYKTSLEPLQRDTDALQSPISNASFVDPNMLLSPLNPTSPVLASASYTQMHIPASLQSPFPPLSSPPSRDRPLHIVLASTGSVASIKIPLMIESLLAHANVRIQVISTKASSHFYDRKAVLAAAKGASSEKYSVSDLAKEIEKAGNGDQSEHDYPRLHFWSDEDEWQQWKHIGDSILHIELRRWADLVLIAPCSANTLAKINAGLCDDLLTSFLRALSPTTPTYLFPAMNTLMYMHPLTASHLAFARDVLGYYIIGPIEKRLACGDLGQGAMQEWSDIVDLLVNKFSLVPAVQDVLNEEAV